MKKLLIAFLLIHAHAIMRNPAYARPNPTLETFIKETETMAWEGYGVCAGGSSPELVGNCRAQMMLRVVAAKHAGICYKAFSRSTSKDWYVWNHKTNCLPK